MKKLKFTLIAFALVTMITACGGDASKQEATAEGFSEIENQLKEKFGDGAYFTDINIVYSEAIGNIINVTTTKAPESLKMGQWVQSQGAWTQSSEISLEVPEGTLASDFMYQLDDKISLNKLGELVEKSKKQLQDEKNLKNPTLVLASILFPKNGDASKTEYLVNLKPENGGTSFQFYYKLNGELVKMDY